MNQPDSETVAAPNIYDVTMRLAFATARHALACGGSVAVALTLDQAQLFAELSVIDGRRKAERQWRNLSLRVRQSTKIKLSAAKIRFRPPDRSPAIQ
ncbi:hypothetical protein [Bradyrhizobium sp.]|jgi:hypothetical protein|uniref:hypothetical protein n=1 Tax=Bradyrhizobium sp. TaxID=376 RepID=UPI003D13B593